ncbi:hypothetical protein D3C80_1258890 [compost metagenome]
MAVLVAAKLAVCDQVLNEGDGAQLGDQRGVEQDLVQPIHDLTRLTRGLVADEGVERQQQDIVRRVGVEQRPQRRIGQIAAVPIGLTLDLYSLEQVGQAGRGQQDVGRDLSRAEQARPPGADRRGRDDQLNA